MRGASARPLLRLGGLGDLGRARVNRFVRESAARVPAGTLLLDAGAGECDYRELFGHARYVSVDLAIGDPAWNYGGLDVTGDLGRLPFRDETFGAVLSTQTLEHVVDPQLVANELHRVLAPGGRLFLTVPMAQAEHQAPHDYFRFTSHGLRSILGRAGFTAIDVRPLGGMFARLAYELPRALWVLPGSGLREGTLHVRGLLLLPFRLLAWPVIRVLQLLLLALDPLDVVRNDPLGWSVEAGR